MGEINYAPLIDDMVWSYSRIKAFEDCPYRWYLKYIKKFHGKDMRKALKDNNGFCPCAIEKNEDTKCMCKEFREMASGTCHCGLYTKTE